MRSLENGVQQWASFVEIGCDLFSDVSKCVFVGPGGRRYARPANSPAERNNNNNNIYLLQLGCHPVAVVILHVYKT